MKIAITEWQGRVSPVCDAATHLLIADVKHRSINNLYTVQMHSEDFHERIRQITALGMDVLICGAISRAMKSALSTTDIKIIPQTCGKVEDILTTFATGRFSQDAFLMPGCCSKCRRFTKQCRQQQ
ncbi:MAG: hypothetical protein KAH38_11220 [Candidatus Hydrogenedentes bacterium]|nr:hypothetical protein [Candidatus Hydrogenedentota bacterium]